MTIDTNQPDAAETNPWRTQPVGRSIPPERVSAGSWIAGLGALVLLTGGAGYSYFRGSQVANGANPGLEAKAREYIAATLKDPSSAQFRNVTVHNTCVEGEVNAKNAFGGYVGFTDFYYDDRIGKGAVAPEQRIEAPPGTAAALNQAIEQLDFGSGRSDCLGGRDMSKPKPPASPPAG